MNSTWNIQSHARNGIRITACLFVLALLHVAAMPAHANATGTLSVGLADADDAQRHDYLAENDNADEAIQQAVDALPSTGGVVVLGEGTFVISASIEVPNDRPVTIRGQGATTVIDAQGARRSGFSLEGGPLLVLRDMVLRDMHHGVLLGAGDPAVDFEHIEVRNIRFERMGAAALTAGGDMTIRRLIIANNDVKDASRAFVVRNQRVERADITGNTIRDLTFRGIMVGTNTFGDEHYWRNITIANNSIHNIINEGESHVMGILGYGTHYQVANNRIENVRTNGSRAEGIYLKVTHSNITHNKLLDAGGSVGAIALPGSPRDADPPTSPQGYSNAVTHNLIQFENPGVANPRGIDLRQQELLIAGNIIEGFRGGIIARRGGHVVIANNRLSQPTRNATRFVYGIAADISTGSRRLGHEQNLVITGNEIYHLHADEQAAYGIYIRNNHAAGTPSRFDNMIINNNLFWNFTSERHARGIWLLEASDEGGGMARLQLRNNLFEDVGTPIHGLDTGDIRNLVIEGNLGYATEATGTASFASGEHRVEVSHELIDEPNVVIVTPRGDPAGGVWVSERNDTTFTVTRAAPGDGALEFDWQANVRH